MSKKTISFLLILLFFVGLGCSNVGKPSKRHKGQKINSSGKMARYK